MNGHKVPRKVVGEEGVAVVGDRKVDPGEEPPSVPTEVGEGTTLDVVLVGGADPSALEATCAPLAEAGLFGAPARIIVVTPPELDALGKDLAESLGSYFKRGALHVLVAPRAGDMEPHAEPGEFGFVDIDTDRVVYLADGPLDPPVDG